MQADHDDHAGGAIRFDRDHFAPAGAVVKADQVAVWRSLGELRAEADLRIAREIDAAVARVERELRQAQAQDLAERTAAMVQAFDQAAAGMEQAAMALAIEMARRLVRDAEPPSFFERAAEHLRSLVPPGQAVRVRVHPQAIGQAGSAWAMLESGGSRHVEVLPDDRLSDAMALVVETAEGKIDLSAHTHLERLAAALRAAGETPAHDRADAPGEMGSAP